MELSIIIVHYNTPKLLLNCINSINNSNPSISYEIIIIDNNSKFSIEIESIKTIKNVKWITNKYNAGFSRGNNLGIKNSKGEYVLLLNPDTEIKKGFLDIYVKSYKNINKKNNLGLLTCRIISLKDNSLLIGSKIGFPSFKLIINENPIIIYIRRVLGISFKKKYDPYLRHKTNHEIDVVSGSCVLFKKSKFIKLNLFLDEDFFLYFEDVEWSFRVKKNKLKNYFIADIEVFHVNSASTNNLNNLDSQKFASELLFYYKTYGKYKFKIICLIIHFNLRLNIYLHKRKNLIGNSNKFELKKLELSKFKKIIESKFSPTPSSSSNFHFKINSNE